MFVQILVDNPNSWIIPYAEKLKQNLLDNNHRVLLLNDHDKVVAGDILCLLSCEKKFKNLHLNKHNLVVHESALPKGKGWSPLTWQILEGKKIIPITLFEASENIDSGVIYLNDKIVLAGNELIDEIRVFQGNCTVNLIVNFINNYDNIKGVEQKGESSFYKKRKVEDSKLDINKSIKEQFNLLRVVDNERYPAYFEYKGGKYKIQINKLAE